MSPKKTQAAPPISRLALARSAGLDGPEPASRDPASQFQTPLERRRLRQRGMVAGRPGSHVRCRDVLADTSLLQEQVSGCSAVAEQTHAESLALAGGVVSDRLREDYDNGRTYYPLHGHHIAIPSGVDDRPARKHIEWHNENVFKG